jgi:hypothetical protein
MSALSSFEPKSIDPVLIVHYHLFMMQLEKKRGALAKIWLFETPPSVLHDFVFDTLTCSMGCPKEQLHYRDRR